MTPPAEIGRKKKTGLLGALPAAGLSRGSPGPDAGYALTLVHSALSRFILDSSESAHDIEVGVALIAARRAAQSGRAPSRSDVEVAADLFGLRGRATPAIVEDRRGRFAGVAHSYAAQRALVDTVSDAALSQRPGSVALLTPRPSTLAERVPS